MIRDMTKGNIYNHIVQFSIPIILGNIFQLTYNAVDSIIVGKFAGTKALAAVGTSDPIVNMLILGISGICIGASVLMSEFFGAKIYEDIKNEFATTISIGMGITAIIVILGLLLSNTILKLIQTPPEIMADANSYLKLVFIGAPFTCIYNIYSAGLRSIGDSKTPINFLAISSVLNGCLDYIFIKIFDMGVVGAGLATVFAEGISAVLCMVYVFRKVPMLHVERKHFKFNRRLINRTFSLGSITALQQCCQPFGKLFIQSAVNYHGVSVIAAFNAASKIENFALIPEQSISHSMMTFTAQNRGAKEKKRVKLALPKGLVIEIIYWIFICTIITLFKTDLMSLFGSESDHQMITEGVKYLSVMAFLYCLSGLTNGLQGYFRGLGNMSITFISTSMQITIRVIFTFILSPSMGIEGIAFASGIGWIAMLVVEYSYYFWYRKKHKEMFQ